MEFVAFPLQVGARGWLERCESPEASILQLIKIMASTPQRGWTGWPLFGLRDRLLLLGAKHDLRLSSIREMNEALKQLEIDWVGVKDIRVESESMSHDQSYVVTLFYPGGRTLTLRI